MRLALVLLQILLWQFPATALSDAPVHVVWGDLAPSTAPYDDPFLEMSYKEKDDLRTVLKASQEKDNPALASAAEESRARLREAGHDADELLAQRLVVMEKR